MQTPHLAALLLASCAHSSQDVVAPSNRDATPVEFGRVAWSRDHDAAFARAKQVDRPVFLLFQEVPG